MTADEWLQKHGKRPYRSGDWVNWALDDGIPDPDDDDFIVPPCVFERLTPCMVYPDCKAYRTQDEALADFRQAFDAAVAAGWNPEE